MAVQHRVVTFCILLLLYHVLHLINMLSGVFVLICTVLFVNAPLGRRVPPILRRMFKYIIYINRLKSISSVQLGYCL